MLARVGVWCFSNPRKTVAGWLVIIVAVVVAFLVVGSAYDSRFETPDSESRSGREVLTQYFGDRAGRAGGAIVFRADSGIHDPAVRAAIEGMLAEVAALEGVIVTSPYAPEPLHRASRWRRPAGGRRSVHPAHPAGSPDQPRRPHRLRQPQPLAGHRLRSGAGDRG